MEVWVLVALFMTGPVQITVYSTKEKCEKVAIYVENKENALAYCERAPVR